MKWKLNMYTLLGFAKHFITVYSRVKNTPKLYYKVKINNHTPTDIILNVDRPNLCFMSLKQHNKTEIHNKYTYI